MLALAVVKKIKIVPTCYFPRLGLRLVLQDTRVYSVPTAYMRKAGRVAQIPPV